MNYSEITSPCGEYKSIYRPKHKDITDAYFDDLVKRSKVDVDTNAETIKKRNVEVQKLGDANKILKKYKVGRGFLIALAIILIVAGLVLAVIGFMNVIVWAIAVGIVLPLIGIGLIIICAVILGKKIKNAAGVASKHQGNVEKLTAEAYAQMAELNKMMGIDVSTILVEKALPIVSFDKFLEQKRLALIGSKYGLNAQLGPERSILCLKSGELANSPFMIAKILSHNLGTKTYTGSITITYTTGVGKNRTTRTQTLTASVTKPCPYYFTSTKVIFASEAAPNLSFSRKPGKANGMTDEKIDKMIAKEAKKVEKDATKKVGNETFQKMANNNFEVLFKALDRDHEVEFRLLFTPSAQTEMVKVIKDDEVGYGDDFYFDKSKMLNILTPAHLDAFDLSASPRNIIHFDFKEINNRFKNFQYEYFRQVYYAFAPIFAIPLYQQHKPLEFIYKGVYDGYLADWQHEAVCNCLPIAEMKHHLCTTPAILKTRLIKKQNDADIVQVSAFGYQGVPQTTVISVMGGDGRSHSVPVQWIDYRKVSKDTEVVVKVDEQSKYNTKPLYDIRDQVLSYFSANNIKTSGSFFSPSLFAFIATNNSNEIGNSNIKDLLIGEENKK